MKFLIVDDHPIMRFGVRHLIAQAWPEAVVVEADSVAAATSQVDADGPFDAIVLDLSLPDASGTEAPALVLRAAHGVPIVVLSLNADAGFVGRLLQMGISGYVPKSRAAEELAVALREVLEGRRHVPADLADRLPAPSGPLGLPHEQLSAQELRVMQLLAAGRSARQIADSLHVSVKSVGSYRARVFAKAGWTNNLELVRYCEQHGLVAKD